MIRLTFLITILLTVLSCSENENLLTSAELDNPSAMTVFCQASLDDPLKLIEYKYVNDNLITETSIKNGEIERKTTFQYNSINQIISEVYSTDRTKTEKTFVYNGINQLTNILYKFTNYDDTGQIVDEKEAPREYENNLLVKEWQYWGGFSTYKYHNGKVSVKISHTKQGEKHHITTYKYSGSLLSEEKKETKTGNLIYLKTYKYDSQNRLIQIQDGEKVIEENDYVNNKLMEKRIYYFGIDPGFDVCYGNYIYRYKY